jgi:hypothetical protein
MILISIFEKIRFTCITWEKLHSFLLLHYVVCIILIHSNLSQFEISDILRVHKESTRTARSVKIELHTYTRSLLLLCTNYTMTFY